jgi:hypothetical protein
LVQLSKTVPPPLVLQTSSVQSFSSSQRSSKPFAGLLPIAAQAWL